VKVQIATAATIALASVLAAPSSRAESCHDKVARFERLLQTHQDAIATAPTTIDAQLSRQPTPASVEEAQESAKNGIEMILAGARTLAADGRQTECLTALKKAKLLLGRASNVSAIMKKDRQIQILISDAPDSH
jgi:hypothetical protein